MNFSKIKRVSALILAIALMGLAFSSCGAKLSLKGGMFVNSKTGVKYSAIRGVYLPKAVADEPYITFKMDDVEIEYYEIEGLSPEEWLVSDGGDLIYSGDASKLPEFADFGSNSMFVCRNSDVLFSIINEKDQTKIDSIVGLVKNTTPVSISLNDEYESYKVLFSSDAYPYIYYQFKLFVTADTMYLVDPSIGAYYDATSLFSSYSDISFDTVED